MKDKKLHKWFVFSVSVILSVVIPYNVTLEQDQS